jgi:hypothetical protein
MAQTGWGIGVGVTTAGTTLTALKNICKHHGWHNTTTSGEAELTRFINRTLQLLASLGPWPEYHKLDGRISLTYTTGAIASIADAGSGKVTVTSTAHGLAEDDYINISGSTDNQYDGSYFIDTVTTNTFKIVHSWLETDTGTWGCGTDSYVLTNNAGTTLTNIAQIGDVMRDDRAAALDRMTGAMTEWLRLRTVSPSTGPPREYALQKYVVTGDTRMKILIRPFPTSSENGDFLRFPYRLLPVELSAGSDVTDWPDYRLGLLEQALETRINSKNRDHAGTALNHADFMQQVHAALADARPSYMPVKIRPDTTPQRRGIRDVPIQIV